MDNTPHHRCHVMDRFGEDTSLSRIIINRQSITFPTGVEPANGVYGALEVLVDDDPGDIDCCFVLIGDDEDLQCPEFGLKDDFVRHIREEAQLKRPKTLIRKFDLDADIGKVFEFDGDKHGLLMRQLAGQWLANYLATNFTFQVEIIVHGHSINDGADAIVRMIRPWSGICEAFRAEFEPEAMFVGQDSLFGRRFFGKAA